MDSGDVNAPHSMGTTIIGVTYDGGVVLGADSRTSTGMYVANRASDKITQLTDNVYVCRSGSAADSQIVSDYVRYFLHQHTIQLGQPSTVKVAANLVRLLSYNNKNMLQTGLIVGGWDKYEGGKIYGIPLGGTVLELPFTIGGSGSSYLYGFFDQAWKEGMTREEAEQLVVKAVSLAIARDGASGGVVRTVTINKDGVTRKFYPGDTLPLWHEEMEPQNSLLDTLSAASPEPMSRQGPTYKYCDVSISSIYFTLFLCCQNLLYFLRDKDTRSSNAKAAADDMIYDGNLSFLSSRKSDSKKERQLIRRRLQLMLYNIMYRMMFDAKFESQNDPLFIEATKFNEQSRLAQSFDYNYGDFILLLRPLLKGYLKKCRDLQSKRVAFFNSYYVEKRRKVMAENGQKRKLSCAIDHIIDAQIEGEISEENVRYIVENINVAAIETTLWSMEWAIAELANHPAIQCKIRDEISTVLNGQRVTESNLHQLPYLQATVKETLRLHTPIPLLVPHMNLEEAKLGGYTIPKESKVVVNAWWLANNPAWWKNPNEFRPERFMEEESSAEALAEKSTSGSCSLAWGGGAAPESFLHYQFSAW